MVIINATLQYDSEAAAGTGMVINADGLVLTNNHVTDGSTKITVTVASTGRTYQATVVGYDKTGDIALIQLQNASGLTMVPIGNSASVKAGKTLVATGNAQGQNAITATAGQVTALNQTITVSDDGGSAASETLSGMIETNADIVPGDSGAPWPARPASSAWTPRATTPATISRRPGPPSRSTRRCRSPGRSPQATPAPRSPSATRRSRASSSAPDPAAARRPRPSSRNSRTAGYGGSGSTPACDTSNANLTVPSTIAPVSSGTLVFGTICGSPAASAGLTGGAVITAVNVQAVGSPDDLSGILSRFHLGEVISVTWVSPSGQRTTSSLHLTVGPRQ